MKTNKEIAAEIRAKTCELNTLIGLAACNGLIVYLSAVDITNIEHNSRCLYYKVKILEEL